MIAAMHNRYFLNPGATEVIAIPSRSDGQGANIFPHA
jgi:hypothetical protein